MSVTTINPQEQTTQSSWMPSLKTLAWGALALGTIAAVGAICYSTSFPEAEAGGMCTSSSYLKGLSESTVDLCSDSSPYNSMCIGNLGFTRSMMPQLNTSTLEMYLAEKAWVKELVDPSNLTPVQSEMSMPSIAGMIGSWMKGVWDPCQSPILSADGYVIDGHHRWAACALLDRPMTILNIQDTAQNVLSELANFNGVFSLALGQPNL